MHDPFVETSTCSVARFMGYDESGFIVVLGRFLEIAGEETTGRPPWPRGLEGNGRLRRIANVEEDLVAARRRVCGRVCPQKRLATGTIRPTTWLRAAKPSLAVRTGVVSGRVRVSPVPL
ncbi:MAG: hypothetical protein OXL68_19760 [Paracoccaceae bacterium]|nr:hypothetical protein [Paracoccaceae bacterium]